jgi:hypothetical protein
VEVELHPHPSSNIVWWKEYHYEFLVLMRFARKRKLLWNYGIMDRRRLVAACGVKAAQPQQQQTRLPPLLML